MKTKLRKIGNSYGIILSQEAIQYLQVKEGDEVHVQQSAGNSLNITKNNAIEDPDFEKEMALAYECMDNYHNALKELPKK